MREGARITGGRRTIPARAEGRPRVLVVHRDPSERTMLCDALAAEGLVVVGEPTDWGDAVRLAVEHAPCIVLVEVAAPGLDALDVTPLIEETKWRVSVILLTAYERMPQRSAEEVGAFEYLVKGTSPRLMGDVLRHVWIQLMENISERGAVGSLGVEASNR